MLLGDQMAVLASGVVSIRLRLLRCPTPGLVVCDVSLLWVVGEGMSALYRRQPWAPFLYPPDRKRVLRACGH